MSDLAQWQARAREWLRSQARPRDGEADGADVTGLGSVAVFDNLTFEQEQEQLAAAAAWQRAKLAAGYGAITWPPEFGGAGLAPAYEEAFGREEAQVAVPRRNELFSVTLELVAPTIAVFGTPAQQRELIPRLLAAELFVCQLFSEPGAGSDLASLSLRAERREGGWVLNGQKVWTSGARHAALGELIARTDPARTRHRGLTAFLVPMDAPGVEIRPIRQMSGGSSFNEVFFTGVEVPDEARLGEIGQGWQVALTTLGFERAASGAGAQQPGGSFAQVAATARQLGRAGDPLVRQMLADLYVRSEVQRRYAEKMTQSAAAGAPGEDGSVLKLMWSANLTRVSAVVTELLGPRLVADTGEPGLFGWSEHVLGGAWLPDRRRHRGDPAEHHRRAGPRPAPRPPPPHLTPPPPWALRPPALWVSG
jgi:alkylation response protein AidB-like acyl-CoA dehydrogenase